MRRTSNERPKNGIIKQWEKKPWHGRTCGECRRGEWNDMYFNYKGEPFLIYCVHSNYAFSPRRNCATCLDSTPACEHFDEGKKGGTQ